MSTLPHKSYKVKGGGGGVKNDQYLVHVVIEWPLELKYTLERFWNQKITKGELIISILVKIADE